MVATSVTAVFTGWAIWQRWRYTARPLWVPPRLVDLERPFEGLSHVVFAIENRGAASAFDVHVYVGVRRRMAEQERRSIAEVATGELVRVSVDVAATGNPRYDAINDKYLDPVQVKWDDYRVRVVWRQHPSLRRRRRCAFQLRLPSDVVMPTAEPGRSS
jgi:hypothetical protein